MEKDILIAANANSLLFNTGIAQIAEKNFSNRKESSFELPEEHEGKSDGLEKANANEGQISLAQFTSTHIYTIEQFLIFRNIT
tara:strand:- start:3195 stop:3443 length:249 start_codon:yes stop_codon:yes gene_type:complete